MSGGSWVGFEVMVGGNVDGLFIKSLGDEKDDEVIVSFSSLRMEMITRRKTRGRMIFLLASIISGESLNATVGGNNGVYGAFLFLM